MRIRSLVLLAFLTAWGAWQPWSPSEAWGAETVEEVAARLRGAAEAGEANLQAAARSSSTDLWLVAEHLATTGQVSLAADLARLVQASLRYARLPAYVAWRRTHPLPADFAARAQQVFDDWKAGRHAAVKKAAAAVRPEAGGVTALRVQRLTAYALEKMKEPPAAIIAALREAGAGCAGLGWYEPASRDLSRAFDLALKNKRFKDALDIGTIALELSPVLRDRRFDWGFRMGSARAARELKRPEEALRLTLAALPAAASEELRLRALRQAYILERETKRNHSAQRRLHEIRRIEVAAEDQVAVASTDVQLAMGDLGRGRLASALARLQGALAYLEIHGTPGHRHGAHLNAANIWLQLRDGKQTRAHIAEARKAGALVGIRDARLDMFEGCSWFMDGKPAAAEAAFQRALDATPPLGREERIGVLLYMADLRGRQGRPEEALASLAAARGLVGETTRPQERIRLGAAACLAYLHAGHFQDALDAGERARALVDINTHDSWICTLESRIAWAHFLLKDLEAAQAAAARSITLTLRRSSSLPDALGVRYRDEVGVGFAIGIESAGRLGDADTLFRFAEQARAVALRQRLGEGQIFEESLPSGLRDEDEALEERERLAVQNYRSAVASGERAARVQAKEALESERRALDLHRQKIRTQQAVASQYLSPEVQSLSSVVATLEPRDVLVAYAQGLSSVFAIVASRKSSHLVRIGGRENVEALIQSAVIDDPVGDVAKDIQSLRARLLEPLKLGTRSTRVLIVPSGSIGVVPFAALLPEREVLMLPSATVSRLLRARDATGSAQILAVAAGQVALQDALPEATKEAQAVGHRVLTGKAATESALRRHLASGSWRSVHVACHGLIDPENPLRSALALEPSEERDGLLTVSEVLGERIRADLVALSACSSGRGRVFEQEGAFGFTHAFFIAGAPRVLVTLWDVEDASSAALMKAFYAAWTPEVDVTTALHRAQRSLREDPRFRHPRHWAGWQLWGAP